MRETWTRTSRVAVDGSLVKAIDDLLAILTPSEARAGR